MSHQKIPAFTDLDNHLVAYDLLRVSLADFHVRSVIDNLHDTSVCGGVERLAERRMRVQRQGGSPCDTAFRWDQYVERMALRSDSIMMIDKGACSPVEHVPLSFEGRIDFDGVCRRDGQQNAAKLDQEKKGSGDQEDIRRTPSLPGRNNPRTIRMAKHPHSCRLTTNNSDSVNWTGITAR